MVLGMSCEVICLSSWGSHLAVELLRQTEILFTFLKRILCIYLRQSERVGGREGRREKWAPRGEQDWTPGPGIRT